MSEAKIRALALLVPITVEMAPVIRPPNHWLPPLLRVANRAGATEVIVPPVLA